MGTGRDYWKDPADGFDGRGVHLGLAVDITLKNPCTVLIADQSPPQSLAAMTVLSALASRLDQSRAGLRRNRLR
jgi:hypothetical protein